MYGLKPVLFNELKLVPFNGLKHVLFKTRTYSELP